MQPKSAVSREEWTRARLEHMKREKELTRLRDELAAERRELPWVRVDEPYAFDGPDGRESLCDLFAGRSQLVVYHFMFGPNWEEGCKSCSFWADTYDGTQAHLAARDVSLVAISRAPYALLEAFRKRMGWTFKWVSSNDCDFNFDFEVSFRPEDASDEGRPYNFGTGRFRGEEAPGLSVFALGDDGAVYHTYSAYARGLDIFNGAYHMLDVCPKGRDEEGLEFSMAWLRLHDQYED